MMKHKCAPQRYLRFEIGDEVIMVGYSVQDDDRGRRATKLCVEATSGVRLVARDIPEVVVIQEKHRELRRSKGT